MCGIIGYLGKNNALPVLIDGLKRLEYRGYDSSGIALHLGNNIQSVKAVGRIKELEEKIFGKEEKSPNPLYQGGFNKSPQPQYLRGCLGIAHTRWATHGEPSEDNAHPHSDCSGKIWIAHNGIIENYKALKEKLEEKGHKFKSQTDTEVIAHLIEDLYDGDLTRTLQKSLKLLKGAYGIVLIHKDHPEKIMAAKIGSPLAIGLGGAETIIASDISAIIMHTKQVIYLDDGEIAEIGKNDLRIFNIDNVKIEKKIEEVDWDIGEAEKNAFPHFMLKEIFEQPESIMNSIRGRVMGSEGKVKLGGFDYVSKKLRDINRIIITACGTAMHAGLVGEYMLEEYAGISTEVEYASEFRYRKPIIDKNTAVLAISQSGETADTLAAIREAKEKNALTLGIVNVVGSTIAREIDAGAYNHIGPEISVASTKAFTSQVAIMALMAVYLGRQRQMSLVVGERIIKELLLIPEKIKKILGRNDEIKKIAEKYMNAENFFYLGRKYNNPTALEGALKLKEISYIHAEGIPSGEMKHGSIALIDENFPSMFICPQDSVYEKNVSNMEEVKSRGGKIIAIATEGDGRIKEIADDIIYIPKTLEMLTPILAAVPLQLFAYHISALKGLDVDKPRNLAKSVTVE
ncbi:MAG: glutamine--fructose-6-phosphate transaminase (isomerizing) [Actinobacteria bacterium]|nr:glutamine--fructose-6-phosphate transaminase (isomerizing) [Actinomycetota bacterium]